MKTVVRRLRAVVHELHEVAELMRKEERIHNEDDFDVLPHLADQVGEMATRAKRAIVGHQATCRCVDCDGSGEGFDGKDCVTCRGTGAYDVEGEDLVCGESVGWCSRVPGHSGAHTVAGATCACCGSAFSNARGHRLCRDCEACCLWGDGRVDRSPSCPVVRSNEGSA